VFRHLNDWFSEFRLYHRKDGKVVKEGDDLMAATRYAIMMLRFASTKAAYDKIPPQDCISQDGGGMIDMSAFAVVIGGKADMGYCTAHVGF